MVKLKLIKGKGTSPSYYKVGEPHIFRLIDGENKEPTSFIPSNSLKKQKLLEKQKEYADLMRSLGD